MFDKSIVIQKENYKMKARIPQGMGGGPQNMAGMLKQAQKMQERMEEVQRELEEKEYEIKAGGGAVAMTITGKKEIKSIEIDPDIVDPDDIETLTDVLTAAFNEAIKKVEETQQSEMSKITGDMNIPGLF